MPELPDVETFKRYFDATSLHKRVEHVHLHDELLLDGVSRQKVVGVLVGEAFEGTTRRGKYLGARTTNDEWLILHFGMTGSLQYAQSLGDEPRYTALLLELSDDSQLAYINKRRFGKISAASSFDDFIEARELGPDALDVDLPSFRAMVAGRRGSIKSLLMNQKILAGVGNVYADEMLFHAGVMPDRNASSLSEREITDVHAWLMRVLKTAIDRGADADRMPESWLLPRRAADAPCTLCNGMIASMKVSGRTTYFCPSHQG